MRLPLAAAALLATTIAASAQNVSSAFTGFSSTSGEPVNVESDNLEVQDANDIAIFTGSVVMKQGDSTLTARKLTVFYYGKDENAPAKPGAEPAAKPTQGETKAAAGQATPESGRDIKKMEAEGDVVVIQKDQKATGARGVFSNLTNTADMTGGVVVTQNGNVVRGERLHVDMNTQTSRVESGGSGGRVQGVFKPRQQPGAAPAAGAKK